MTCSLVRAFSSHNCVNCYCSVKYVSVAILMTLCTYAFVQNFIPDNNVTLPATSLFQLKSNQCPEKGNLENFKGADPRDSEVVNYFKCHHLTEPSKLPYNFASFENRAEQLKFIEKLFRNKKTAGFFIEVGANDGEARSNTFWLELHHKWSGLLIEASPRVVPYLKAKHRSAWVADVCLSPFKWPCELEFKTTKEVNAPNDVGKLNLPLEDGLEDPDQSNPNWFDPKGQLIPCFPLITILTAINVTHVDYFSLDVQGAELKVLMTLPWDDSLTIDVIQAEFVYDPEGPEAMVTFMEQKGYSVAARGGNDIFFVRTGSSIPPLHSA